MRASTDRKARAEAYRKAAEASFLEGNGASSLGKRTEESLELIRADPYYYSHLWDREQWCMAFCLLTAMVEAGDA